MATQYQKFIIFLLIGTNFSVYGSGNDDTASTLPHSHQINTATDSQLQQTANYESNLHFQALVKNVQILATGMSGFDIAEVIPIMSNMSVTEQNNFSDLCSQLAPASMPSDQRSSIIYALAAMPENLRTQALVKNVQILATGMSGFDIAEVIPIMSNMSVTEQNNFSDLCSQLALASMSSDQRYASIYALAAMLENLRTNVKTLTAGMSGRNIAYVIKIMSKMPATEQNNFSDLCSQLAIANMPLNERREIITVLAAVPEIKRTALVKNVKSLTAGMNGFGIADVIKSMSNMPGDEQNNFSDLCSQLAPASMPPHECRLIIVALATVPEHLRTQALVKNVKTLTAGMNGFGIVGVIEIMHKIPEVEQNNFSGLCGQLAPASMPPHECRLIIVALATVPEHLRTQALVKNVKTLATGMSGFDIADVIKSMSKMSEAEQNNFSGLCSQLATANMPPHERRVIITVLAAVPENLRYYFQQFMHNHLGFFRYVPAHEFSDRIRGVLTQESLQVALTGLHDQYYKQEVK